MSQELVRARVLLKQHFGYDDFRAGQVDVVASVLSGADTLGVLPTGGGKSLCYQVPALAMPGLTLVISPLISLMKDQVDRLRSRGIASALLNSTLPADEVVRTLAQAREGSLKLLYAAPERLEASDLLRSLMQSRVSLVAVDEAHCVSEWGHDFRPSFRRIAAACERMGRPQMIALTATATPAVRADIARQLQLREPRVIVCGFDRTNLSYAVHACRTDEDKHSRLMAAIRAHARPCIVYASTRTAVERLARRITRSGIRAAAYHGGLRDKVRHEVQEKFMSEEVDAIVATNAFGMGIDKPNVRLVVHEAMPGTLEAYYQEAGRAGRDGKPGHCVLLYGVRDRATHEWFIRSTFPSRESVARVHRALAESQVRGESGLTAPALHRVCGVLETWEVDAAVRLLRQAGALADERLAQRGVWIRLMATPARIRAELHPAALRAPADPDAAIQLTVLRTLWRRHGERLHEGITVRHDDIPAPRREVTRALDSLRGRQFLDAGTLGGLELRQEFRVFDMVPIDWGALEQRRRSSVAKLDMMEGYARTRECRRAFVLAYFGERAPARRCGGCDNCLAR